MWPPAAVARYRARSGATGSDGGAGTSPPQTACHRQLTQIGVLLMMERNERVCDHFDESYSVLDLIPYIVWNGGQGGAF